MLIGLKYAFVAAIMPSALAAPVMSKSQLFTISMGLLSPCVTATMPSAAKP
jgi:hypothetical protein